MGFTVTREGGTKDAEFRDYARLLRQSGLDLGKLPRVAEPETQRRWLHLWDNKAQAQKFANELKKRTGDNAWKVVKVTAPPSEGPLGPLLILLARRGNDVSFGLYPLSEAIIQSAYPDARGFTSVSIDTERWRELLKSKRGLESFVRQAVLSVTGLTVEQLATVGYAVMDDYTDETQVYVAPEDVFKTENVAPRPTLREVV